ncbi:hypothetical protein KDAU_69680 [Dictyobacter aurantiacus]|uniref:Uncharacterized protein n=1 Tax=Dictyobacter aurantiacus TaxID=1936993 RepID=A0A401ZRX4_9CHLR|nr:hypothetical protein KDAU_69680 [Dictyobacter aurantiacus]
MNIISLVGGTGITITGCLRSITIIPIRKDIIPRQEVRDGIIILRQEARENIIILRQEARENIIILRQEARDGIILHQVAWVVLAIMIDLVSP